MGQKSIIAWTCIVVIGIFFVLIFAWGGRAGTNEFITKGQEKRGLGRPILISQKRVDNEGKKYLEEKKSVEAEIGALREKLRAIGD